MFHQVANKLSEKEVQLITFFGFGKLLNDDNTTDFEPMVVYRMAAEHAFMINAQGPEADSLRRCMFAFRHNTPYRLTQEWDDMIEFSK